MGEGGADQRAGQGAERNGGFQNLQGSIPGGAQVGGSFKASSERGIETPTVLRDRGLKVGIPKGTLFSARVWGGAKHKGNPDIQA